MGVITVSGILGVRTIALLGFLRGGSSSKSQANVQWVPAPPKTVAARSSATLRAMGNVSDLTLPHPKWWFIEGVIPK